MYALFFVSSNCEQHRNLVVQNQSLLKTEWRNFESSRIKTKVGEELPVPEEVGRGIDHPFRKHAILGLLRFAPTCRREASSEVATINRLDLREHVADAVE
jgi:hypothetical protein